ncbi:MAG TPA: hypothetical protein VFI23_07000 [Rhizomicrobium sp.]|nr:hypothetical protein [Rhizomicrobium sp.]
MLQHVKVIAFSVGLLPVLSGLSNVSFALVQHRTVPVPVKSAAAVSPQAAQSSVAAEAALRAIAGIY